MTRTWIKPTLAVDTAVNPPPTRCPLALRSAGGQLITKKSPGQQMADLALEPSFGAATVVLAYLGQPGGELSVTGLIEALKVSIEALNAGDMSRVEAMLFAHAQALQAIFVDFAGRAARADRPEHREPLMRMAMKAQNQCRMTLDTLSSVKNPPIVVARQTNIAHGPQQVNSVVATSTLASGPPGLI